MGNRSAKFISTLVASIIAGVPLAAVSQNAPSTSNAASTQNAASTADDDCLASPKATAPQGQHWYYRLDRASKRKCWYLRAEGDKGTQTSTVQNTQNATRTADAEPLAPHPVQDARAEYVAPQGGTAPSPPNVTAPTPTAAVAPPAPQQRPSGTPADNNVQQPAVSARWPDPSPAPAAPEAQPAAAPVTADAPPSAEPSQSAAPQSPAPMTLATADASAKPTGSLQTLLLVIGGALALAGITGSVIYRFAGSRVRVQAVDGPRRVNWDNWEQQDQDHNRAPWRDAAPASRVQRPRPVDFDVVFPRAARPAIADNLDAIQTRAIEDEQDGSNVEAFKAATPAPQFAAIDAYVEEAQVEETHIEEAHAEETAVEEPAESDADAVDIDVITQMLEQLAKEGPRLTRPNPEAGLADFAQSRRGQSAARA
ncbi:hypothetical protein AYJ54_11435 [Bradyrhizobium centrolobii]|uniref:Uncharacterized protein n=1 Tax=Bradyrhizobium centrolobii TaxID=1505087 RepID=A0A176YQC1_9BRAD|nr:hypothetical protein [Bradyrhizobium centrolobii]OAF09813.1 hypothetical protein AYJ54_11435 [Bradyrhizobium centrolobii]